MHFWVSTTRGGFHCGFCCPRKIGTNWFMPALVKRRFGASGSRGDDGTMVGFFSRKKSRNDCRISAEVMIFQGRINTNFRKPETAAPDAIAAALCGLRLLAEPILALRPASLSPPPRLLRRARCRCLMFLSRRRGPGQAAYLCNSATILAFR